MDDQVIAAISRWPNVPGVFGWLSLSAQGQWRLHPQGDAWDAQDENSATTRTELSSGEAIGNARILSFINRNYAGDTQGRWYFQNGPQRVFVRLDAAPFILHLSGPGLALQTHSGLDAEHVAAWWLDDEGKLYARTEHGPGLIAGRDTMAVFEALRTIQGQPLLDLLESDTPTGQIMLAPTRANCHADAVPAPLKLCKASEVCIALAFVRFPRPDDHSDTR
jgi:hypothetical protein